MKPRKKRRSIRRERRWFFLKLSSRDKRSFSARARQQRKILIAPVRRATRIDNDSPKRSGTLTRKNRRRRNPASFTTPCFARANGCRQGSRWRCFYRRKTSRCAHL